MVSLVYCEPLGRCRKKQMCARFRKKTCPTITEKQKSYLVALQDNEGVSQFQKTFLAVCMKIPSQYLVSSNHNSCHFRSFHLYCFAPFKTIFYELYPFSVLSFQKIYSICLRDSCYIKVGAACLLKSVKLYIHAMGRKVGKVENSNQIYLLLHTNRTISFAVFIIFVLDVI